MNRYKGGGEDDDQGSPSSSRYSQLVRTVKDIGVNLRERLVTVVFERRLGRSAGPVEDGSTDSLLVGDPHETIQRSYYGSVPSPGYPLLSVPPVRKNSANSSRGINRQGMMRRKSSGSRSGQFLAVPGYHLNVYQATAPEDEGRDMDNDSNSSHGYSDRSIPPFIPGRVSVPTINVEKQEDAQTREEQESEMERSFKGLPTYNSVPTTPQNGSYYDLSSPDSTNFTVARNFKIAILLLIFVAIAAVITVTSETEMHFTQISASEDKPFVFPLKLLKPWLPPWYPILTLMVKGAFVPKHYGNFTSNRLTIAVERRDSYEKSGQVISDIWEIPIFSDRSIGIVPESMEAHAFGLSNIDWGNGTYTLVFRTNTDDTFPVSFSLKAMSKVIQDGAVLGGVVIVGLYILIIFELVNRTLSAILAATAAIGVLAFFNERPTTEEMVSWLDMETLILLFSMMILVSILCETGFFDYCAYMMYKITSGEVWPMITSLCLFTAVVSAFLDNVTTVLLMTPVTIRICEAMELNPVPILISIVIFSNIGGTCTPVGDPPNVIISNNPEVVKNHIDFAVFTTHMLLGVIPVIVVAYIQLRIIFRSMKSLQFSEPYAVAELRREIEVWSRAAHSLSSYSKDESHVKTLLLAKVVQLKNKLKQKVKMGGQSEERYKANLQELKETCKIRDWPLLIKCGCVLATVITLFFLHSVPQLNLSMGWTALLGAVLLLVLADPRDLEGILSRVEWSTLIFFSALFIVMEAVSRLGLLDWIGNQTEALILNVNPNSRLTVAVLLILWVSGIASAFIDNIPFTTMMIKIVIRVASNLSLPLQPLVFALSFGTCLGGNGTLIGASANVVCAGVADQHGYRFTFMDYFRIGFPMMMVSLIVATFYLLLCHSVFSWNY